MEKNRRVPQKKRPVLAKHKRQKSTKRSSLDTFRSELYALTFEPISGEKLLKALNLSTSITYHNAIQAFIVNKCLQKHPGYIPKIFDDPRQTVDYILTEANRLAPGYIVKSTDGVKLASDINKQDLKMGIENANFFMEILDEDKVHYPYGVHDLIIEIGPIQEWKNKPEYPVLYNAVALLFNLGFDDVAINSHDGDIEHVYTDEAEMLESEFLEQIKVQMEEDPEKDEIDEKTLQKKARKLKNEELEYIKNEVLPTINNLQSHTIDFNVLVQYVKDHNDDLSSWVRHLLALKDEKFNFRNYQLSRQLEYEEFYPVDVSEVIGIKWDRNLQFYKFYDFQNESLAGEAGFTGIGISECFYMDGKHVLPFKDVPVMHWIQKALDFDLNSLCYNY